MNNTVELETLVTRQMLVHRFYDGAQVHRFYDESQRVHLAATSG